MRTMLYGLLAASLFSASAGAENSKSGAPTLRPEPPQSASQAPFSARALAPAQAGQKRNFISTFESSDAEFIYRSMQYGKRNRR